MINQAEWAEREKGLRRIVGARLTSVQFVLNYLILGFDEKGALTTLVWPELHFRGKVFVIGKEGYRDHLCSLIEQLVKDASMEADETISIYYADGPELRIPLRSYEGAGERAILTAPPHYLLVF